MPGQPGKALRSSPKHGGRLTATTLETITFDRPHRVSFRLVRRPVPHVAEQFALTEHSGTTTLTYSGELGTDFGKPGNGGSAGSRPPGKRRTAPRSPASGRSRTPRPTGRCPPLTPPPARAIHHAGSNEPRRRPFPAATGIRPPPLANAVNFVTERDGSLKRRRAGSADMGCNLGRLRPGEPTRACRHWSRRPPQARGPQAGAHGYRTPLPCWGDTAMRGGGVRVFSRNSRRPTSQLSSHLVGPALPGQPVTDDPCHPGLPIPLHLVGGCRRVVEW